MRMLRVGRNGGVSLLHRGYDVDGSWVETLLLLRAPRTWLHENAFRVGRNGGVSLLHRGSDADGSWVETDDPRRGRGVNENLSPYSG